MANGIPSLFYAEKFKAHQEAYIRGNQNNYIGFQSIHIKMQGLMDPARIFFL